MSTEIRQVLPSNVRDALLAGSAPSAGNPYLTASAVSGAYYPLSNPAGYITSAALAPYLTIASAAATYLTIANAAANYQPLNTNLTGLSSLVYPGSLGFVKMTAAGTFTIDTNVYLTTAAAAATYYPLTNPAGYITASGLTGYVPYTGATASLDMGFHNIVTGGITSANQRELRAGTSSGAGAGFVDIGSYSASPNYGALYINQTAPGANNYTLLSDGSTVLYINAPTTSSNLNFLRGNTGFFLQCYGDQVGGVDPSFLFSTSNRATIPAGTQYAAYYFENPSTNQWATGTVPNFWNAYFDIATITAVGPSTFTNAYGLYVEAPLAGPNATITNNYAAGFNGSVNILTGNLNLVNTTSSTKGVITKAGSRFIHNFAAGGTTGQNTWIGVLAGNFTLTGSSSGSQGSYNVAVGYSAGSSITTGNFNTLIGHSAGAGLTTGQFNMAVGRLAGSSIGAGNSNLYIGEQSGVSNTGSNNVAIGQRSGFAATAANSTTTIGYSAGLNNTANNVTFVGAQAGQLNTSGLANTALGWFALYTNSTSNNNTALGYAALSAVTAGDNLAVGYFAGYGITTGTFNIAIGNLSLQTNSTSATNNTIIGHAAFRYGTGNNNTAIGYAAGFNSLNTGSNNTFLGFQTGYSNTTGSTGVFVGGSAGQDVTTGTSNTLLGYNTGRGITTGLGNTILGANVTALPAATTNNIILSQGDGTIRFRYNPGASSGGIFQFISEATTNQTASVEVPMFIVKGVSTTLATGALTTQRFTYLPAQTISFLGASTVTNAYGLYVEKPTAGTNAVITNSYAAGFAGNVKINDTFNLVFDTSTGTKIATATTQKLGFWNVTPIVQPATGGASATFLANAGTAVNDASTFDGYTMGQVVKALRNTGLLA